MTELAAFVGHSFTENDSEIVRQFLKFFDRVRDMDIGFSWDHAEAAEPKVLVQKVREKMEGKNLFIGICTAKECTIDPLDLSPVLFYKKFFKGRKESFSDKTSDWIIQEIGFAVGKGMDIILIIESGLRVPGGLQGDLEYISFHQSAPEKSFTKILEMLQALRPKRIDKETGLVEKEDKEERVKESGTEDVDSLTPPTSEWKYDDYRKALVWAMIKENNEREQDIYDSFLNTPEGQEGSAQICWEAERLYYRFIFRHEDTFQKIKALSEQNPDEPQIYVYIGRIYDSYEQYQKAAEYFERAASLDVDASKKLRGLCAAALAYSKGHDVEAKQSVLHQVKLSKDESPDGNTILLETLADIAELEDDDDSFLAFNEALLGENPDYHARRFSLAYKYAELDENDLSLYHYKLLTSVRSRDSDWNNMGVAQSHLQLPGKSVTSYRQSEKLGGTLAMSNVAHAFIKAGFVDEAQEICDRATQIENYDQQVGSAITELKEKREAEDAQEKEYLDKVQPRRVFYMQYSSACLKPTIVDLQGAWSGPDGHVTISVKNTVFDGKATIEQKTLSWGLLRAATLSSETTSEKNYATLRFTGNTFGYGVKFSKRIEGKEEKSSVEGLMVIQDDLHTIRVYEKGSRSSEKFYDLTKIS